MSNISNLISQMQQPSFYPHAVTEKIELIQTHASYVFLTGDYVYKLKKEVNFGFLDYSTLAKRKHCIETELRLNQKIAPELYLEVLPICRQDGQFAFGDEGEIVEYALKMRAFPQSNRFDNLLSVGKLQGDRLTELGKIVAQFHLSATTNDDIRSFGTVAKIKPAFDENYQQSQKYIGTVQTKEQLEATQAYTDRFFSERENLFQARIEQHKIKECHGDLHLKNICLWRDRIQLFDRIEFNESFRFVDTMYDIAFLAMDLEARQKPDLKNAFLNSYLEYTGDWIGLLLLPLYLCRQAYVRAKVNSFLLDNPEVNEAEKQQAEKTARNYYRQAYQYTQTGSSGSLILMSGLSGSGKSTVARNITRQKGAIQIRSDAVRKHFAGIPVNESGSDEMYSAEMSQKTYDRLTELGILLAKERYLVILDAKYDRAERRQKVISRAKAASIPLQIVYCTAPLSVLRDRLTQRQDDISDAGVDLIDRQQANAEAFTAAEKDYVTTIDTSLNDWQEKVNQIV